MESIRATRSKETQDGEVPEETTRKLGDAAASRNDLDDAVDSILDEIDEVLEENAEEFVEAFVQRGGQ